MEKFGQFIALSLLSIGLLVFLAISVSVTHVVLTWAFGPWL